MKPDFLNRSSFLALLMLVLLAFSGCDPDATYTSVYIVRHAEVVYTPGNDNPSLTPQGAIRAQDLKDKMNGINLSAIYVTEKIRTQETAAPTSTASGVAVTQINDGDNQALVDDVLNNHAGTTVLIVNHSHNIKDIIDRFHCAEPFAGPYPGDDFDKLFLLIHTRKEGAEDKCGNLETTYGAVSP
ncbi:MAG: histidine phosphatase family protein [Bacteroidia bacterium]|nr:histidine phosphatase family protein [Bacteroidia bacterium]